MDSDHSIFYTDQLVADLSISDLFFRLNSLNGELFFKRPPATQPTVMNLIFFDVETDTATSPPRVHHAKTLIGLHASINAGHSPFFWKLNAAETPHPAKYAPSCTK